MRVVELFAGIGGFRLAADNLGFETVWANDINHRSANVYRSNFGDINEGDINEVLNDIPEHDLLTAGFPCQPFSSAGKKLGVNDPRGTHFATIVQILEKHCPKYFVLENVKRLLSMENGQHFATILFALTKLNYQIEWRLLNARNYGLAQNRQRVLLLGIREEEGLISSPACDIKSNSKLLLENDFAEVTRAFSESMQDYSSWLSIENFSRKFPTWGLARRGKFFGGSPQLFNDAQDPVVLTDILQDSSEVDRDFDFTDSTLVRLGNSKLVERYVEGVQIYANQSGGARMGYTVFGTEGIAPTLTASTSRHYERYKIGDQFRRLTNVEYARIQGFPDDHCDREKIYHQYELYGNAVPPPMVKWVFERMLSFGICSIKPSEQHFQGELY